jgi:1,4-alpha-glucan branching enzyme
MNDTLGYMAHEPIHRRFHHHDMTFGLTYAWSENYVLPLSHDEVVHGKGSLIAKMPGPDPDKFANLRAYFGFMWAHPGKKLLFMGGEFAQWAEWDHARSLDWHLLEDSPQAHLHRGVQRLVRDLNTLYRATPALHVHDTRPQGFRWLEVNDAENSVYAWLRFGQPGDAPVAVVANFTPVERVGYRIGLPRAGRWREVMNTDAAIYGGGNRGNMGGVTAEERPWHDQPASTVVTLPPLSVIMLMPE